MATDRAAVLSVPAAAAMLLWPALWNGYPIVFADTGTYLSQAIHRYAGWDRPVFYSFFMLPLHATVTTWPVIVVQALLAAWVLRLACRALAPGLSETVFLALVAAVSLGTWLPWLACTLMPDVFTPLLVLALCLLALVPERLRRWERVTLAGLASFMIACQLSSLPLAATLAGLLLVLRRVVPPWRPVTTAGRNPGHPPPTVEARMAGRRIWHLTLLPVGLAILALCAVNLAAHGRFAIAPFGNVFLLARVLYDGPGLAVLRRDCPAAGWRLCGFLDRMPPTSDDFLWEPDSPLYLAGGPKAVSREAGAIIAATIAADAAGVARAALANTLAQLARFASGDGLGPWPIQVTPWIARDFPPAERAAYATARQQRGRLAVPPVLAKVHRAAALAGVAACLLLLPVALRRRAACAGFLAAVLSVLPVGAAITGALSGPHDRYQARVMWLPPFVAAVSLLSLRRPP